jgi:hypothetical protein
MLIVLYVLAGWCLISIAFTVLWSLLMACDYENVRPLRRRPLVKRVPRCDCGCDDSWELHTFLQAKRERMKWDA